jgi:PAS domain-containing protein
MLDSATGNLRLSDRATFLRTYAANAMARSLAGPGQLGTDSRRTIEFNGRFLARAFRHESVEGACFDVVTHWARYDRAPAAGETKYEGRALPTRSLRDDGSTIYVELTFAIIHDATSEVVGACAHARDISERWAADREQRRRLRDLEEQLGKHA